MRTRDFGMGFFGRRGFDFNEKREYFEEWSKMSPEEKIKEMDKRANEMAGGGHCMGDHFGGDMRSHFAERWTNMSQEEKETFIKEKDQIMKDRASFHEKFFGENGFNTTVIDDLCEEWMKKTQEEKEEFIRSKMEAHRNRHSFMKGFFGGGMPG